MVFNKYGDRPLIFNIQRYSIHDGPGIRTIVFLKGCPLCCPWCANPEGKAYIQDIFYNFNLCRKCGQCEITCPTGAISMLNNNIVINRDLCTFCEKCIKVCKMDAIKIYGHHMSVEEILDEVSKDEVFFQRSGGGLTVSGGEPLSHVDFLYQLLKKAKEEYFLNTAIETSCYASPETIHKVIDYIDYFIADIKLFDSDHHYKVIGVSNEQILHNIQMIANDYPEKQLMLRMPVIPSINDDIENIRSIGQFLHGLKRQIPLELLPYHEFGKFKYMQMGNQYRLNEQRIFVPDKEYMNHIEATFRAEGVFIVNT